MSCVSFKKTQNTTFFVLILKLTFMLMHHSQKNLQLQKNYELDYVQFTHTT